MGSSSVRLRSTFAFPTSEGFPAQPAFLRSIEVRPPIFFDTRAYHVP
jgi:hypothetical protein